MSAWLHSLVLVITVSVVYLWLHIPVLDYYSLQAIAGAVIVYAILKRLAKAKLWHIAPTALSLEMAVASFALLLIIGETGNTTSPFFPLSYLHLFFLVLATSTETALIMTIAVMVFHYALPPMDLQLQLSHLLSLPMMTLLFLFTKKQYETAAKDRVIIAAEEQELQALEIQNQTLRDYTEGIIKPKLSLLLELSTFAQTNQKAIQGQLTLLQIELDKVLERTKPPKM